MSEQRGFALVLSWITVGYNLLEGVVSVAFALLGGSSALLGFGLDSFVESLSGGVMIWRFSWTGRLSNADREYREHIAIRLVGVSLIILAGYVIYESVDKLYFRESPDRSPVGLIIAAVSLIAMPVLYIAKRRTAMAIESRSLATDAKQTLGCILLSVALLVGTGLHYWAGIWQADPIAGLFIAAYLLREGYKAWTEQKVCCG